MLMPEARRPFIKMVMVVGRGTSGGYGWRCGKSLALGIVRKDLTQLELS